MWCGALSLAKSESERACCGEGGGACRYGAQLLDTLHGDHIVNTTPLDPWRVVFYQDLLSVRSL
eukprot:1184256-Prorocentrum_minimum.AAC.2